MSGRGTGTIASDGFECDDVKAEELALFEVGGLALVQHPADVGRSVAGIAGAGRGLVEVGVIGVLVVGVVGGTLLGGGRGTGLSQ